MKQGAKDRLLRAVRKAKGLYEIIGQGQKIFPDAALSGIAGIGHILLSIGLIWMMSRIIQIERQ